jgi:protein SCO1/2
MPKSPLQDVRDLPASELALDRRRLLGGTAMAALALSTGGAAAQQGKSNPHAHHGTAGGKQPPGQAPEHTGHGRHAALVASVKACVAKGEACIKHCIALLNQGDTSLVDCLKTVTAMIPICRALERYAVIDAKHLRELSQLCITVNEECEAECRKHADHHTSCRDCADACTACITECNKLLEKKAQLIPFQGRKFTFLTHKGETWNSASLDGTPAVVFFGFTDCPSVCPTTLQDMTVALDQLGRTADDLKVLFVSVDPERDTVPHLGKYLASFDGRITGLTGDPVEVAALAHAFKAFFAKVPNEGGYTMDHTTTVFLLDRAGALVDELAFGARQGEQVAKLRGLLARKTV